jgi:hypothetical protein
VTVFDFLMYIKVITKLPNSEQSYKGKVQTHYINRQNQSTTTGACQDSFSIAPNIAILCTLLSKAIRFLPVNFLFDSKTLIVLLESLFSSLSVDFN